MDLKTTVEAALAALNAGSMARAHEVLTAAASGQNPPWLTEDAGLPRDWRGNPKWNYYLTQPTPAERKLEAELPLWLRHMLFFLRQELDFARRALEHRNARIRELKARQRFLQRYLKVSLPKKTGPLGQFIGATISDIRHSDQGVALTVQMPPGSYHPDRDLEVYTLSGEIHVRIDGMFVPFWCGTSGHWIARKGTIW
jgi:hypothetical protein